MKVQQSERMQQGETQMRNTKKVIVYKIRSFWSQETGHSLVELSKNTHGSFIFAECQIIT